MIYFAINSKTNRAEIMHGFKYWEEVQSAFGWGIRLSDQTTANGIGRCKTMKEFVRKANHGKTTILMPTDAPHKLTILSNGSLCEVTPNIWRSWTGKRFIDGIEAKGSRFYWLSDEVAPEPKAMSSLDKSQ